MTLLILGVALWAGAHLFKRVLPAQHARLGSKAKPVMAVLLAVSVVLMVIGYRAADGAV
ncbi:MAG: NnrU family protein, partial [Cypionkella sp.]